MAATFGARLPTATVAATWNLTGPEIATKRKSGNWDGYGWKQPRSPPPLLAP
jgi:hypothetical protein